VINLWERSVTEVSNLFHLIMIAQSTLNIVPQSLSPKMPWVTSLLDPVSLKLSSFSLLSQIFFLR